MVYYNCSPLGSENGALLPTSILVGLQDFVQSILLYCSPQRAYCFYVRDIPLVYQTWTYNHQYGTTDGLYLCAQRYKHNKINNCNT